jgi:hypothetical protein
VEPNPSAADDVEPNPNDMDDVVPNPNDDEVEAEAEADVDVGAAAFERLEKLLEEINAKINAAFDGVGTAVDYTTANGKFLDTLEPVWKLSYEDYKHVWDLAEATENALSRLFALHLGALRGNDIAAAELPEAQPRPNDLA